MKKISLILGLLTLSLGVFGQNFNLISSSDELISFRHILQQKEVASISIQNENYQNYASAYKIVSADPGAPALPFFTESVLLPDIGNVELIIEHDGFVDYQNVLVAPSKGSLKRNQNPSDIDYSFSGVYTTDAFYPAAIATLGTPFILRKTRGTTVKINPFQYNPVTKVLRVYSNIRVSVIIDKNVQGENELQLSSSRLDGYTNTYLGHYINATNVLKRYSPIEENGDLLIITHPDFESDLAPFVNWKIQKGIKTEVVTTAVSGTTDTDIKSYIQNYYSSNPNLLYILLVGDHEQIPSHTYGASGSEQLWSDSYYAQLAGTDFYPEVFIGRFSASQSEDLTTQIDRVLEYEKNPVTGAWMANALGLGSNEGSGYGDDGEADYEHLRNIRTKLMNFGYANVHEFYQGSQGGADAPGEPTSVAINSAIDNGIGLFNYTGHGWTEGVSTGDYTNTSINQLQNNGKYPFVVSVACNNGTFVGETCFSEAWARATHNGNPAGAIGAAGSSILMAWAEPMQTQDEMTDIITESYSTNRKTTLGGLFYNSQMSMLETYSESWTAQEVMQTWVLFADPTCVFRTKETNDLTVTHIANVPLATTSVVVNCNVEDAFVSIVQDSEILGIGKISGGVVTINFPMLTVDSPLTVTATKQNYRPYQGTIQVANGPLGIEAETIKSLLIYPNPANEYIDIQWEATGISVIELKDMAGKTIHTERIESIGNVKQRFEVNGLSKGLYFLTVSENNTSETRKIIIK